MASEALNRGGKVREYQLTETKRRCRVSLYLTGEKTTEKERSVLRKLGFALEWMSTEDERWEQPKSHRPWGDDWLTQAKAQKVVEAVKEMGFEERKE